MVVSGEALGMDVCLSTKSIHFGEVQLQSTTNRLLNICNNSSEPTSFQFYTDKANIFSFSKTEGTIKPHSQARIIIEFFPQHTVNYYERIFCIVCNHQILYVDLIGTCYDVLNKPMPLMQRHVDIYRHKVIMGVHNKLRRDKHGDMVDTDRIDDDIASIGVSSMNDLEMNQEIPIDDPSQVVLHKEMFSEVTKETNQIILGTDFIDFSFG